MDHILLAVPLFFVLMGLELAWSLWSGRGVYRFSDTVANLGCGIGSQLVGAFTKSAVFAVYAAVYSHARLITLPPSPFTWLLAFLLIDLLYYWFHRLSHEVGFLWAAHVVHHQSEEYNLSVALRQSWWQGLFSFWFYVPVALLGVDPLTLLLVAAFVTLYQFWIHTTAIGRLGPLEWVLNTPSHHRVHHGSDPKYIDRNHAGTLIIWDKLFGTFQREEEEPVYGITVPLRTWDPLRANLDQWGALIRLARQCRTWKDRLLVFLKPPGWRPGYLGGSQGPKQRDRASHRKFETAATPAARAYTAAQFVLLLGLSIAFLLGQGELPGPMKAASALLIVHGLANLGALLEGRRWALWSEAARALLTAALLGWALQRMHIAAPGLPAGLLAFTLAHLALLSARLGQPARHAG
ncbi:MAG: sterol desaturase family protein [Flavobacteriales bacterium]